MCVHLQKVLLYSKIYLHWPLEYQNGTFYAGDQLNKNPLNPKYCTSFSNKISGNVFLLVVSIVGL